METKYVTLDELLLEAQKAEQPKTYHEETVKMIQEANNEVLLAAGDGNVTIHTDYDADGICSAYIMEKLIKEYNPDCKVNVQVNDRREAYGISPDIELDCNSRHIFLDMGSNQLNLLAEKIKDFDENNYPVIIDHHLIENTEDRTNFASFSNLCNPHAFSVNDKENAQYCATGLVYEMFSERQECLLRNNSDRQLTQNDKLDNTVAIVACIGTATDMVDVLDPDNRRILKDGIERINKANPQNTDFALGYILQECGIGEDDTTAHQIAFNVGSFINSASRMSEIINDNGGQRMYNAMTGGSSTRNLMAISKLVELNGKRKDYVQSLQDDDFKQFVDEQRFHNDGRIAVYGLPDNTPSAFAGLVAGKLAENTGKSIICLSYSEEKGCWSGSGRNIEGNESLKEFLDKVLQSKEGAGLTVNYGGHHDAVGISSIPYEDGEKFVSAINAHKYELEKRSDERILLKLSPEEINSPETLEKLQQLEPTGVGFKIPPIVVEGKELHRSQYHIKGRDDWKRVDVKDIGQITDWSYTPEAYPQDSKGNIKFLAEVGINTFRGQHVELTAKWDKDFFSERSKELSKSETKRKSTVTFDKE